jgi:Amiloride-sensitive sodium channel
LLSQCNCVSAYFTFTDEQWRSVSYTVCGNQTSFTGSDDGSNSSDVNELNGFRDLACSYNANVDYNLCRKQCKNPCVENIYDVSVATSGLWPDPRYQKEFYKLYIQDSQFADKFSVYKDIIDDESLTSASFLHVLALMRLHAEYKTFKFYDQVFHWHMKVCPVVWHQVSL